MKRFESIELALRCQIWMR